MNINDAKLHIKNTVQSYLLKDEIGEQIIKTHQQRPIFLMGPPGIGKTEIMKQVAEELNIALVSYSMTHHTRQSALGLPFIIDKNYEGNSYKVSEYTMSEILSTVYDLIEETGMKEGILFLDEINCVSETLAPSMLQFLQYKTFGRHKVPDGWIVCTAGNPIEFNNSVKEFDLVTWDRLKRIDVEADFSTWKTFAYNNGVHPAIISYLETNSKDFYSIETTIDGVNFVTARGWTDLSKIIFLYEKQNFKIDITLVSQYIQNTKISREFSIFYDLFNKYKDDYHIDDIINGNETAEIRNRCADAKFDELLVLVTLIYTSLSNSVSSIISDHEYLELLIENIKLIRSVNSVVIISNLSNKLKIDSASGSKSSEYLTCYKRVIKTFTELDSKKDSLTQLREIYNATKVNIEKSSKNGVVQINNAFAFLSENSKQSGILSIFISNIVNSNNFVKFLSKNESTQFIQHSKGMLITNVETQILKDIEDIEKI